MFTKGFTFIYFGKSTGLTKDSHKNSAVRVVKLCFQLGCSFLPKANVSSKFMSTTCESFGRSDGPPSVWLTLSG